MLSFKKIWSDDRGFIWLLVIMVLTIIVAQFSIGRMWAELLFVRFSFLLFTIIALASSVFAPAEKRIGYGIAILLFLFSAFLAEINTPAILFIHGVLITAYMSLIFVLVVKQIMRGGSITVRKILGGVAAYILLGHLWASVYVTIYQINPSAFQMNDDIISPHESLKQLSYFSFVSLTTIGYGDITAIAPIARAMVILEGLLGQLFPAIFIAKLVSLQIEHAKVNERKTLD